MKNIVIKEINHESFKKYGTFANMINPSAPKLGEEPSEFFRDMVQLDLGNSRTASFSTCRVLKRDFIISELEYHNHTGEGMLPLDGDILLSFAPATQVGDLPIEDIEVFHVSRGTLVSIRPGVWHCAAFPVQNDCVNVLIALPERVYANDCHISKLPEEIKINKKMLNE